MNDNDFISTELDWDNPGSLVDLTPPPEGKKHFGLLKMYQAKVTKHWEAGKSFSIPGVTGGTMQEKDANGNMLFKSYTKGGDDLLYILVATKESQTGEPYQMVKQLPGKRYRKSDRLDFINQTINSQSSGLVTFAQLAAGDVVEGVFLDS